MLLAAKQTVRHRFLQLPNRAQPLLECLGIFEFGNLLELVDANNDIATFLLRYLFRELQNFIDFVVLGIHFKRDGEVRHRIGAHRYFRADTRKK